VVTSCVPNGRSDDRSGDVSRVPAVSPAPGGVAFDATVVWLVSNAATIPARSAGSAAAMRTPSWTEPRGAGRETLGNESASGGDRHGLRAVGSA
jgi:hypothetical protein